MMMTLVVGTEVPLVRSLGPLRREGEPFGESHTTLGSTAGWVLAGNRAEEDAVDVCPGYPGRSPKDPAQGAKSGNSRKRAFGFTSHTERDYKRTNRDCSYYTILSVLRSH